MDSKFLQEGFEKALLNVSAENSVLFRNEIAKLSFTDLASLQRLYLAEDSLNLAYTEIGLSLGDGAWGTDALKAGKKIVQKYKSQLQTVICKNEGLRKFCLEGRFVDNYTADSLIAMAAIIAGGLLGQITWNIDIIALSFIGAKMVMRGLCKVEWQSS